MVILQKLRRRRFKSKQYPSQLKELDIFEKDLFKLVKSFKFRNRNDEFQNEMKDDIKKIKSSLNVFIPTDKTTNMYELTPKKNKEPLRNNVTKTYRKAPPGLEKVINLEAKEIAKSINLDDCIECIAKNNAFVTLKDHKQNFRSAVPCRLINPCKSELGKISKIILENINKTLIEKLNVNQWKNTETVIHWFKSIEQKSRCLFIQFDVIELYPSITETILEEVIVFAKQHTEILEKDLRIIKHCRKSLLYHEDEAWKKKESESCFDVTMGSNDGAEICELTGIYILSQRSNLLPREDIGLYRDDGLILLRNRNEQLTDRIRENVIKLFKEIGFKIEIETNVKIVNYLDVTFNLANNTYKPYRKPNDNLLYIRSSSNHPP